MWPDNVVTKFVWKVMYYPISTTTGNSIDRSVSTINHTFL